MLGSAGFIPGGDFVLDGLRHVRLLAHLERIAAPSEVRLIFLEVDDALRSSRVGERSANEGKDFSRAGDHAVEADMAHGLPEAAHAKIDGSLPDREVVRQCVERIEGWRKAASRVAPALPAAESGSRRT